MKPHLLAALALAIPAFATVTPKAQNLRFSPLTVCRLLDTRVAPNTKLNGINDVRTLIPYQNESCGVPSTAKALSLIVTGIPGSPSEPIGYITIYPADGGAPPSVSNVNPLDRIRANSVITGVGPQGGISYLANSPGHLIIDVNGYFSDDDTANFVFYPITPCRIVNSFSNPGDRLNGQTPQAYTLAQRIQAASCQNYVPTSAAAFATNITVVPVGGHSLGYLTAWPTGPVQPLASNLNDLEGLPIATSAILPARHFDSSVSMFATDTTDILIDITGYFALPGENGQPGMTFNTIAPCRAVNTFGTPGLLAQNSQVFFYDNNCLMPPSATAIAMNATVVPSGSLGYISLWGAGSRPFPETSHINAVDGKVATNSGLLAINGNNISTYTTNYAAFLLDIFGYFTPATTPQPPLSFPTANQYPAFSRAGGANYLNYLSYKDPNDPTPNAVLGYSPVSDFHIIDVVKKPDAAGSLQPLTAFDASNVCQGPNVPANARFTSTPSVQDCIKYQISSMYSHGNRTLRLPIFFSDFAGVNCTSQTQRGGLLTSSVPNSGLDPNCSTQLKNLLSYIRKVGFREVLISFFPEAYNSPDKMQQLSVCAGNQSSQACVQEKARLTDQNWNVMRTARQQAIDAGMPYRTDLGNETFPSFYLEGGQYEQNVIDRRNYVRSIWPRYYQNFGANDTVGFSVSCGDGCGTSITHSGWRTAYKTEMAFVYDVNGVTRYPGAISLHVYSQSIANVTPYSVLSDALQKLSTIGMGNVPVVLGEVTYNSPSEAQDLKNVRINYPNRLMWLTQWPIYDDKNTPWLGGPAFDLSKYQAQGW